MFPKTLAGIVGFVVVVMFLASSMSTVNITSESKKLQNDMMNSINQTSQSGNIVSLLMNGTDSVVTTFWLILSYFQHFLALSAQLPDEFYVLFLILSVYLVIAIIKIVRGVIE